MIDTDEDPDRLNVQEETGIVRGRGGGAVRLEVVAIRENDEEKIDTRQIDDLLHLLNQKEYPLAACLDELIVIGRN